MRLMFYLRVEINRIFRSKVTWLFILMTMASPLLGLTILKMNPVQTASTQMILNPVLTGTFGASVLFTLFTLFELDKVNKYGTSMLTDAVAPAMSLHIARIGAVFAVSIITGILTILAYYPYTMLNMQSFFDPALYIQSYLLFMVPGMWFGSFMAAMFYQTFRRIDVSFVLVAACVLLSLAGFIRDDFILRWINPYLPVFSDGFGNIKPLRMGLYNRIFWIMFLSGSWLISLLFTRKYEKGIIGSAVRNLKKFYLPVAGAILIILSVRHYNSEPFFNNGAPEVDWEAVNDTGDALNCSSVTAEINPDYDSGIMRGKITYVITHLDKPMKERLIINSGYEVYSITVNGEPIEYTDLADDNFIAKHIEFVIPESDEKDIELAIDYGGYPKLWGADKTNLGGAEMSLKNVELNNYTLIPSLKVYNADVTINVVLPDTFTALSVYNGVDSVVDNNDGTKTWIIKNSFDFEGIYASDYACKLIEADEMKAEFYYHKKFTDILEENNVEEVLTDVFNYCTEHFGSLRYLDNSTLKLIQTSAFNFGGGAISGQSNMGETTFSIYSLTDPWKGASGKEILAHEIIHQWWGLNRMIWGDPDAPEWTAEGLTVYSTYRLYKEKYGEEYGQKNYVDNWETEVEKLKRNFYRRHPEYLDVMPEDFAARIRVREIEVAKYSLMPLKIYKAAELVGGEDVMDKILTKLSKGKLSEQLTYQEFLDECGLTKEDLEIG